MTQVMTQEINRRESAAPRRWKQFCAMLLVAWVALLVGTLVRPSEAAQNLEFRLSNIERQMNQLQFLTQNYERRISNLEQRSTGVISPPVQNNPTPSAQNLEARESLIAQRIDNLQEQLTTQNKMLLDLQKQINDNKDEKSKKTPANSEKKPNGRPTSNEAKP